MTTTAQRPETAPAPESSTREAAPSARRPGSRSRSRASRSGQIAGWLLGALAFVVAFAGSWIPSLWGDEAASILSAERPLPSLFRMLGHVDAVHGTYYLFLHFWIDAFGASPVSVRLPSALVTGVAAAGVYFVARRLSTRRIAVAAAVIFALLPRTAAFDDETRSYAFGAAIAVWLMLLLLRLIDRRPLTKRWWIGYGALLSLGVYTFLYFGLFVVVHAAILAWSRAPRCLWKRWAVSSSAAVVAATPVIVFSLSERNQVAFLAGRTSDSPYAVLVTTWFATPLVALVAWGLIALAVGAAVPGVVRRVRSGRSSSGDGRMPGLTEPVASPRAPGLTSVAVAWFAGPLVLLLAGNLVIADYSPRYLSYSTAGAAILMALGLSRIADAVAAGWGRLVRGRARGGGLFADPAPRVRLIALVVATALVVAVLAPVFARTRTPHAKNNSDWQQISEIVGAHATTGDGIVFDDTVRPSRRTRLAMETYPAGFTGLDDLTIKTPAADGDSWHDTAYSVDAAVDLGRFDGVTTVWLVDYATDGTSDGHSLDELEDAGYRVAATYSTHRSAIVKLVRG